MLHKKIHGMEKTANYLGIKKYDMCFKEYQFHVCNSNIGTLIAIKIPALAS
jgi:hypothetical protein